jgi:hypothetical protein
MDSGQSKRAATESPQKSSESISSDDAHNVKLEDIDGSLENEGGDSESEKSVKTEKEEETDNYDLHALSGLPHEIEHYKNHKIE